MKTRDVERGVHRAVSENDENRQEVANRANQNWNQAEWKGSRAVKIEFEYH